MKIILIHYRYYPASGPERYLFNFKNLFESYGHEIIPFSINYHSNRHSEFSNYFVNPVITSESFHLSEISHISIKSKLKIIKNLFFNNEAFNKLNLLISDIKPDLIYLLQYYGKLSPSILEAATKNNIPLVHRLSDYNLLCSKNIFYNKGKVCTKCLKNDIHSVLNKCTQKSYIKSIISYFARKYFDLKKYQNAFDTIIAPSKFTAEIFNNYKKYNRKKVVHLPTFIWKEEISNFVEKNIYDRKICYFGRIADDKGILTVLLALKILKKESISPQFTIIGDDNNEYGKQLKETCLILGLDNVNFAGFMSKPELLSIISDYSFSVVPSKWYDNMPNSLIESQALGLPVIASKIGSLNELITENYNGFLFAPDDENDLAQVLKKALAIKNSELNKLRLNSLNWTKKNCSEEKHYNALIEIFNDCIENYRNKL